MSLPFASGMGEGGGRGGMSVGAGTAAASAGGLDAISRHPPFSLNPPPTTRLSVASLFSQPPSGPLWSRERLPNCQVNDLPQAPLPTLQSPLDLTLVSPGNSSRPCPLPALQLPPASPGWGRAWAGRVDGRPQQPSLAPLGTLRTQRGTQTWVGWACARKASCRR